ncbi:site-specific DNA-methyltransferase [Planotetraspora sp. GP83]|uniref:DNA-methyltransferase n=1 Tax=Planotetraspora sp. GP83 TaxID=3156264 RepID=UPI00351216E9
MPWRVAFTLQQDGWILRNAIVWHKPNAMPQSVLDRLTTRYELIFMLVKQRRYWFDLDAIREPYTGDRPISRRSRKGGKKPNTIATEWPRKYDAAEPFNRRAPGAAMRPTGRRHNASHPDGKNPGDMWSISTRPLRAAHFAPFPIDIPLRAIAAGCRPNGTVLDMATGSGTTALAAHDLGRTFVGVDISEPFLKLAIARIRDHKVRGGSQ